MFGGNDRLIHTCPYSVNRDNLEAVNEELVKKGFRPITLRDIPGGRGCSLVEGSNVVPVVQCHSRDPDMCNLLQMQDFCNVRGISTETTWDW